MDVIAVIQKLFWWSSVVYQDAHDTIFTTFCNNNDLQRKWSRVWKDFSSQFQIKPKMANKYEAVDSMFLALVLD